MREIVIACGDYDRTRRFIDHTIEVDGASYRCLNINTAEIFYRMSRYAEFDACEMSLGNYCAGVGQGDDRFIALPIFLSRVFRHGNVRVREGSDIEDPSQLKGKRIGLSEYAATAAIWIRGFLQDDYGVDPWDVEWVVARREKIDDIPYDKRINVVYRDDDSGAILNLDKELLRGNIDAVATGSLPPFLGRGERRLFPNYEAVEQDYFGRTGIFPIMHTFVMRRSTYEQCPWLARSLYKAFYEAKEEAQNSIYRTTGLPLTMPWMIPLIERTRELMGPDPWAYGLARSEPTLTAFVRYLVDQGLTRTKLDVAELFAPVQWTNANREEISW